MNDEIVQALIIAPHAKETKELSDHLEHLPEVSVEIECYADVALALQRLLQKPAHVVFIDSAFADADEVVGQIKEMCGDCSIVAMIKAENESASLELLRSGVDEFLVKGPISLFAVVMVMHHAVMISRLRREYRLAIELKRVAQRQLEDKAVVQEDLLHSQKLEAISQLAGGVAHDFNNILGAISGYAEMIRKKFAAGNPKLEKYCSTILAASRRAAELTAQLLTFARKGAYRMAPYDMHDILNRVIALLRHSFDSAIKIDKDFKAREPMVLADVTQIQTALLNIGMNARDAMPGGGSLTFSTDTITFDDSYKQIDPSIVCGEYVAVTITDTGKGMEEHVKTKLFEPFFTTKDNGKGAGLHLAGAFGTIKAHKGYCAVSSEPGRGSSFKLYLPLIKAEHAAEAEAKVPVSAAGRKKVLVVDDEELMRSIFQEMLTLLGYSVELCASGREAIDVYGKKQDVTSLVIIDMTMGDISGMECFRELKKINPRVKAVIASGYNLNGKREEMTAEGIAGILQKPFETQALDQIVAEAMRG